MNTILVYFNHRVNCCQRQDNSISVVLKARFTYYMTEQYDYCVLGTCSTCKNSFYSYLMQFTF